MSTVDQITSDIFHQLEQLRDLSKLDASVEQVVSQTLGSIKAELSVAQQNTARVHFWNSLSLINHDIEAILESAQRTPWLESIATSIRELLKADVVTIYEAFKQGQILTRTPAIAGELDYPDAFKDDGTPTAITQAWVEDSPIYIADTQQNDMLIGEKSAENRPANRVRFAVRERIQSTVILALQAKNDLIGIAFVNYRTPQAFSELQKQEIEEVRNLAAIALNNLRLIRRQRRNADDLTEALEIIKLITSLKFDRKQILQTIIKRMVNVVDVLRGALVLWQGDEGEVVAEYRVDQTMPSALGAKITASSSLENRLKSGLPVEIADVSQEKMLTEEERQRFADAGIKSTLIVPAFIGTELVASIGVDETRYARQFTEREINLCQTLATYTALAIDLADRVQEAGLLQKLRLIQQDVLQTTETPDEAIKKILAHASTLLNCPWAELYAVRGDRLIRQASTNEAGQLENLDIENSITGLAVLHKRAYIIDDVTESEPFSSLYKNSTTLEMRSEMIVPLIQNDRVTHVFNVESPMVGAFNEDAEKALTMLAQQSVTTLQLAERSSQQQALIDVQKQVLGNPDEFDGVLQTILDTAIELLDAQIGQVLIYHDDELVIRASSEGDEGQRVSLNKSITGRAFQQEKTVNVSDLQNQLEFRDIYQWFIGKSDTRSELASPLILNGRPIGVINVESPNPNAFSKDAESTIETLANQAAMAINLVQNVTLDMATRQILRKLLSGEFDLYEVEEAIIETGLELLNADTGSLLTLREDLLQVEMVLPSGINAEGLEVGRYHKIQECISGLAVLQNDLVNVGNVLSEDYEDIYQPLGNGMQSDIVVPVRIGGEIYGVLNFESQRANAFTGYHENVLRELALTAAIAIQRTQILVRNQTRGNILQELLQEDIDLDEIQDTILAAGLEQLGADTTSLFELRGDELQSVLAKARLPEDTLVLKAGERYKIDACLSGLAVIHGKVVNARDVRQAPYNTVYQELAPKMRSDIVAPIWIDGSIYGVINLESRKIGAFTNYHETILRELAATAALAIRTTLTRNADRAKAEIMENLLSPEFNLNATQEAILESGLKQLNADNASFLILQNNELHSRISRPVRDDEGQAERKYHIDTCISGLAVKSRNVVNVSNVHSAEYEKIYRPLEDDMLSDIVAPIILSNQVFGVINLESRRQNAFSVHHETVLRDLAAIAGVAIEKTISQEEARKLETETIQNRFSAEIIHRLNNPLGAVRLWSNIAKEGYPQLISENKPLQKAFEEITTNTDKAIQLISQLRWESRRARTKQTDVHAHIIEGIQACRDKKPIDARWQIARKLNAANSEVEANQELTRVFEDLITNSIEAMEEGGDLTITTHSNATHIFIRVEDTGRGIPKNEIPYLFEDWYTHKEHDQVETHGIGLWLIKKYLTTYRGTITVESEVNVGTTMIISLPLAKQESSNDVFGLFSPSEDQS